MQELDENKENADEEYITEETYSYGLEIIFQFLGYFLAVIFMAAGGFMLVIFENPVVSTILTVVTAVGGIILSRVISHKLTEKYAHKKIKIKKSDFDKLMNKK